MRRWKNPARSGLSLVPPPIHVIPAWGPVMIVKGKHVGEVGWYDDDANGGKAVVYIRWREHGLDKRQEEVVLVPKTSLVELTDEQIDAYRYEFEV